MKKTLALCLCLMAPAAFAQTAACAGTGSASTITGAAGNFVLNSFTPKCSANTHVLYQQNAIAFAAAGGSSKGKNVFGGTSAGGQVTVVGACASTGCTATEPTAQVTTLLNAATQ